MNEILNENGLSEADVPLHRVAPRLKAEALAYRTILSARFGEFNPSRAIQFGVRIILIAAFVLTRSAMFAQLPDLVPLSVVVGSNNVVTSTVPNPVVPVRWAVTNAGTGPLDAG